MSHNNYIWVHIYDEKGYRREYLRRSEFPPGTKLYPNRAGEFYYACFEPIKFTSAIFAYGPQGHAYKLAPRGARVKRWNRPSSLHPHVAEIKRHARRTARRKARQMLRLIDPDGDYDARYNPGISCSQWEG